MRFPFVATMTLAAVGMETGWAAFCPTSTTTSTFSSRQQQLIGTSTPSHKKLNPTTKLWVATPSSSSSSHNGGNHLSKAVTNNNNNEDHLLELASEWEALEAQLKAFGQTPDDENMADLLTEQFLETALEYARTKEEVELQEFAAAETTAQQDLNLLDPHVSTSTSPKNGGQQSTTTDPAPSPVRDYMKERLQVAQAKQAVAQSQLQRAQQQQLKNGSNKPNHSNLASLKQSEARLKATLEEFRSLQKLKLNQRIQKQQQQQEQQQQNSKAETLQDKVAPEVDTTPPPETIAKTASPPPPSRETVAKAIPPPSPSTPPTQSTLATQQSTQKHENLEQTSAPRPDVKATAPPLPPPPPAQPAASTQSTHTMQQENNVGLNGRRKSLSLLNHVKAMSTPTSLERNPVRQAMPSTLKKNPMRQSNVLSDDGSNINKRNDIGKPVSINLESNPIRNAENAAVKKNVQQTSSKNVNAPTVSDDNSAGFDEDLYAAYSLDNSSQDEVKSEQEKPSASTAAAASSVHPGTPEEEDDLYAPYFSDEKKPVSVAPQAAPAPRASPDVNQAQEEAKKAPIQQKATPLQRQFYVPPLQPQSNSHSDFMQRRRQQLMEEKQHAEKLEGTSTARPYQRLPFGHQQERHRSHERLGTITQPALPIKNTKKRTPKVTAEPLSRTWDVIQNYDQLNPPPSARRRLVAPPPPQKALPAARKRLVPPPRPIVLPPSRRGGSMVVQKRASSFTRGQNLQVGSAYSSSPVGTQVPSSAAILAAQRRAANQQQSRTWQVRSDQNSLGPERKPSYNRIDENGQEQRWSGTNNIDINSSNKSIEQKRKANARMQILGADAWSVHSHEDKE